MYSNIYPFPASFVSSVLLTGFCVTLGAGESGKSTIVKQMKIIHQNGFTNEELMSFRPTIYRNTLDSAQAIVLAMRKINVDCVNPLNRVRQTIHHLFYDILMMCRLKENVDMILDYRVDSSPNFTFSPEIAKAIYELWQDPIIPTVLDHSNEFYIMDNAS